MNRYINLSAGEILPAIVAPALIFILPVILTACGEPNPQIVELAELEAIEEIEALLDAQGADWSRGDLEAFTSIYSEDCVYISPSSIAEGRQALLDRYRNRYPDSASMGTLKLDIVEMRPAFVTVRSILPLLDSTGIGGVSVVARWTLSYPDRDPSSGMTLIVFRRIREEWKIVHDASM